MIPWNLSLKTWNLNIYTVNTVPLDKEIYFTNLGSLSGMYTDWRWLYTSYVSGRTLVSSDSDFIPRMFFCEKAMEWCSNGASPIKQWVFTNSGLTSESCVISLNRFIICLLLQIMFLTFLSLQLLVLALDLVKEGSWFWGSRWEAIQTLDLVLEDERENEFFEQISTTILQTSKIKWSSRLGFLTFSVDNYYS